MEIWSNLICEYRIMQKDTRASDVVDVIKENCVVELLWLYSRDRFLNQGT